MGLVMENKKFSLYATLTATNLARSRKSVPTSITLDIWETIKKDLGHDASGSKVFYAIIQKQQQFNSSAVCMLVQALQK